MVISSIAVNVLVLTLIMTGELLQHVKQRLEVDDGPVGARPQGFFESVAAEGESVDHVVRIDDAHHLVRRQIAVLIRVFRSQRRAHFAAERERIKLICILMDSKYF